ncbi:MAG TPA: helix-turn-helix transcriptional regulator [Puia sp.]|nr:helix-turn-helix transcriptional regulator [Puia sp.]
MEGIESQPGFANDVSYFFEIATLESIRSETMSYPVRKPHAQIVWVTRGSGYFIIDQEKFRMLDNTIYMIPPGRSHQLMPAGDSSGHVFSFNADFLNLAIDSAGRPFFKEMSAHLTRVNMLSLQSDNPVLRNIFAEICREFETHLMLRLEILSGLFKIFLVYVKRMATTIRQEEASSHKMRLFNSFYTKLDKQFKTMKQVAEYASELSVSPSYLTVVVKKVSGYSASYHIQQRMVQEAKRMAMYSDANMKMVAYALGFDDPSHFSKFFKHAAGLNFSEFKRKSYVRLVN